MSATRSLPRLVEALLLAADRPLSISDLVELIAGAVDDGDWSTPASTDEVELAVRSLAGAVTPHGGIELVEVGGGWRLRTPPALAPMVRRLWPDRAARLSGAALEVLSIVAYRQPCTRLEIEDVRGVDCGGVLRALLERRLVRIVGKKDEPGRPLLYGTTPEFLETFSLPNLRSMPTLRDLESLRAEEETRLQGERQLDLVLADDASPADAAEAPEGEAPTTAAKEKPQDDQPSSSSSNAAMSSSGEPEPEAE